MNTVARGKPDAPLVLEAPQVVAPVPASEIQGIVKLSDELKARVEGQLATFMDGLMRGDPGSDEFKRRLDQAFSVGRKEIAESAGASSRFTRRSHTGPEDSAAYRAISEMRTLFADLDPARQGDLFAPARVLGIPMPFGNKLASYLRKYRSADEKLARIATEIDNAKDEIAKDVAELGVTRQQLWDALEKLAAVIYFIANLDARLAAQIESLRASDPQRAHAFEQEVLYYVRQNLGDVMAAQALAINAYNVAGVLRKTGRETMNGCDRVRTLGMAALSIAVTLARATGNQLAAQAMLSDSKRAIEGIIGQTGDALGDHVDMTAKFASEPIVGVRTLQAMFDKTFKAMDTMDRFRSDAMSAMQANNQMLRAEMDRAMTRIGAGAREAAT